MLPCRRLLRSSLARNFSAWTRSLEAERETQELAASVAEGLACHKESASAAIAGSLDGPGKSLLLRALIASEQDKVEGLDSAYIDKLFKQSDIADPHGSLERKEFEAALLADRAIRSGRKLEPVEQQNSVVSIALASSIPFLGMGFVDNAIMLVAGGEIDAAFGTKLGISTLAAAGLGNMISDIAGVSMANQIEAQARKLKWFRANSLKAGSKSRKGRVAKLTGSVLGVAVGCLMGMSPLLIMDVREEGRE